MTPDQRVARAAFVVALEMMEELRAAPNPLPPGLAARFQAFVPKRTPDEILATETDPYWLGYAELLREYIELLATLPRAAVKGKRGAA